MKRTLFSTVSALVLALSPSGFVPVIAAGALTGSIVLAYQDAASAQDLDAANNAVKAAKAALDEAKASGEGVKQARQALKAAREERKRLAAEEKAAGAGAQTQAAEQTPAADEKQQAQDQPSKEEERKAETAKQPQKSTQPKAETAEGQPADAAPAQPEKQVVEEQPAEAQPQETKEQAAETQPDQTQADETADSKAPKASNDTKAADKAARRAAKEARRAEREARKAEKEARKAEKEASKAEKAAKKPETDGGEDKPVAATEQPATPSEDAPEAKPLAEAPIEKQIEKAAEQPAAVIPDDVSKSQQKQLRAAEKKRRDEARKNRRELLGAAGVGAVIGALIPALGGTVVEDEGDRVVVERDGRFYVRKDENALFRDDGRTIEIEQLANGRTRETVYRPNGSRIITVRDQGGYALRRIKVRRDGQRIVLFDIREDRDPRSVDYDRDLPPVRVDIPQDQYIVSGGRHGRSGLAEIFAAPAVERVTSDYSLREVRESNRLRSMVRRVDLDSITFDTGSATVRASQVANLADIAGGMLDVIDQDPSAVFLIEGHTDAVGSEVYNLTLSDRRAETVARILVNAFGLPPENLVVQGYGEQYLKIDSEGDERLNRRVAIRNITPLLTAGSN